MADLLGGENDPDRVWEVARRRFTKCCRQYKILHQDTAERTTQITEAKRQFKTINQEAGELPQAMTGPSTKFEGKGSRLKTLR